jgi:hypothetical protein
MWDPILCIMSAVFGVLTVRLLLKRRKLLNEVFSSGPTKITQYTYTRMIYLALVSAVIHAPLSSWLIIVHATQLEVFPWISRENTYSNYDRIEYINRISFSGSHVDCIVEPPTLWHHLLHIFRVRRSINSVLVTHRRMSEALWYSIPSRQEHEIHQMNLVRHHTPSSGKTTS